jgi:hypothetical protein
MKSNYSNYITIEELQSNIKKVYKKIKEHEELFVLKDNKPIFVIQSIDSNITDKQVLLEELLSKVGKKIFIEYFELFKEYERPEMALPIEYSLNSRRSRSSSAKRIFKENLEVEALKQIANSYKLSKDVRLKAEKLLIGYGEKVQKEMKISEIVKNVIPMILKNSTFSNEVEQFLNLEYSKEQLKLYFPLLIKIESEFNIKSQITDTNNYARYYKSPILIGNTKYLLCSQWNSKIHNEKLKEWTVRHLKEIYIKSTKTTKKQLQVVLKDYLPFVPNDYIEELQLQLK